MMPPVGLMQETLHAVGNAIYVHLVTATFIIGCSPSVIIQIDLHFQFKKCFTNSFFESTRRGTLQIRLHMRTVEKQY